MRLASAAIKLGFGAARLGMRVSFGALRAVVDLVRADEEPVAEWSPKAEAEAPARPAPSTPVEPSPRTPPPPPVEPAAQPEPDDPVHLEDEPELVAEFAEAGAEDGAHAEIHVDEPWSGYGKMRVADIRERIAVAEMAELTVVQLYESTHRKRKSILDAVERRSRVLANEPR